MDTDFFTPLPLTMNPSTKQITPTTTTSQTSPDLLKALTALNTTHKQLQNIDPPSLLTPPGPLPVNPKRTLQINKMRDAALATLKKAKPSSGTTSVSTDESTSNDAVRLYSLAIDMALQRPLWEPAGLLREELAGLYAGRAGARMVGRAWADGWMDAQLSLECKSRGNAGAVAKGARCLGEMGRAAEARDLVSGNVSAEVAGLEGARGQVSQIPQGHPNLSQAKEQIRNLERDVEDLKSLAKEMNISIAAAADS